MDKTASGETNQSQSALIAALNAKLLREQNLPLAIVAGLATALAGAILWMGIVVATGMELGLVAIAIGAGVGYAVRYAGKGVTNVFSIVGAVCTLLSCIAGQSFAVIHAIAVDQQEGFMDALNQVGISRILESIGENSNVISYVIYGIGIYEGYKFSRRRVTHQELIEAGLAQPASPTAPGQTS